MITENYIKMCEQAEEIQEAWKPKIGDRILDVVNRISFFTQEEAFNMDEFYGEEYYKNSYIWLPTLEQLFEMVEKQKAVKDRYKDVHFIFRLNWFLSGKYINDTKQPAFVVLNSLHPEYSCSIQELIFAFVMHERWNKVWTGEKWELIK